MMFALLLWLFLFLAVGFIFMLRSNPSLRPVGYALPVVALVLFLFRPSSDTRTPHTNPRLQQQVASLTGEHLARALSVHLQEQGVVLVIHAGKDDPFFQRLQGTHLLEGIQKGFGDGTTDLRFHPVSDQQYLDANTLKHILDQNKDLRGIILVGLQITSEPEVLSLTIPPMILSDLGDPGSSEWALQNGVAKAALFSKDSAAQLPERPAPEAYFTARHAILTASDLP